MIASEKDVKKKNIAKNLIFRLEVCKENWLATANALNELNSTSGLITRLIQFEAAPSLDGNYIDSALSCLPLAQSLAFIQDTF